MCFRVLNRPVRVAVCAAVACLAVAVPAPRAYGAVRSAWSIQPTPNPAGAQSSVLSGVSCSSPSSCTAVGYFTAPSGAGATLAERWNGTRWSIERTPNPAGAGASLLFGVSCASRIACTAVGSVTGAAGTTLPLVERWNGKEWAIQRTPRPARTNGAGVSYLGGVSCASPASCFAVGYSGNKQGTSGVTLAERGNGRRWVVQPAPHPPGATVGFLSGVSCASPSSCVASGFFVNGRGTGLSLVERWNGTQWSIQQTPNPEAAVAVQLPGVACSSQGSCMATGFFSIDTGIEVMLAERWNGDSWSIERTLYPTGATGVQFASVSCVSPSSCTAVGFFGDAAGFNDALAERWNGTDWTIQRTPHPAGASDNSLAGVSCTSTRACTAVGSFVNSAGTPVTLAERY
jgi:hypothetical protein